MKRYKLTTSGVCDCMIEVDTGEWCKFTDAERRVAELQAKLSRYEQAVRVEGRVKEGAYVDPWIHSQWLIAFKNEGKFKDGQHVVLLMLKEEYDNE